MEVNLLLNFYKKHGQKMETVIGFPRTFDSKYVVHDFS